MNIPGTTGQQMTIQFPTSPEVRFCTTWGKQNQQDIAFSSKAVLLLNQNSSQKHICLKVTKNVFKNPTQWVLMG